MPSQNLHNSTWGNYLQGKKMAKDVIAVESAILYTFQQNFKSQQVKTCAVEMQSGKVIFGHRRVVLAVLWMTMVSVLK